MAEKIIADPVWGQVLNNVSRSGGYDWLLSSGEFGDNPSQDEVCATIIEVSFEKGDDGLTNKVIFSDNGKSMDEDGIKKFFTLGYAKYFDSPEALSKYGFGAKGGGYWIGSTITLYCKQNGNIIAAQQNFNDFPAYTPLDELSADEVKMVNKKLKNSEHGTVVVCSDLTWKRSRNLSKTKIANAIREGWRLMYGYLINTTGKRYIVDGKDIIPISYKGGKVVNKAEEDKEKWLPIPDKVINNFETNVIRERCEVKLPSCDTPIEYESWHRSRPTNGDEYEYDIEDWGMLVFRNGRCVTPKPIQCSKLFGNKNSCIKQKGFGCAVYITGEHDEAFGMTYLKVLNKLEDCDEVIDTLSKMTHDDIKRSSDRYDEEGGMIAKKDSDKILGGVNKRLNKLFKEFLHTKTGREHHPREINTPPNPNPTPRPKQDDDILKMRFVDGGVNGNFIQVSQYAAARWYININCQHKLFEEFHLKDNLNALTLVGLYEVCTYISLKVKFDETGNEIFDELVGEYDKIHQIKERFLGDMMSALVDSLLKSSPARNRMSSKLIEALPNCVGVGVSSDDVLNEIDAEEPAMVGAGT